MEPMPNGNESASFGAITGTEISISVPNYQQTMESNSDRMPNGSQSASYGAIPDAEIPISAPQSMQTMEFNLDHQPSGNQSTEFGAIDHSSSDDEVVLRPQVAAAQAIPAQLWDAMSNLVSDFAHQNILAIPFFSRGCFTMRDCLYVAVMLISDATTDQNMPVKALLVVPSTSETATCDASTFMRSLELVPDEYLSFLEAPNGQHFLDSVFSELTGGARRSPNALATRQFSFPTGITAQINFDGDLNGLRQGLSAPRAPDLGVDPIMMRNSFGSAGVPSPSKVALSPRIYNRSTQRTFGQDAARIINRELLGLDGIVLAKITCLIIADGHGSSQFGVEWSAGATEVIGNMLMEPQMDALYLLFQSEASTAIIRQSLLQIIGQAKERVLETVLAGHAQFLGYGGMPLTEDEVRYSMNSCGTTLAFVLGLTFMQGQLAGITRYVEAALGDSSIAIVELATDGTPVKADVRKHFGWDTPEDYADYKASFQACATLEAQRAQPVMPTLCTPRSGRYNGAPALFLDDGDRVFPNHSGMIARINWERTQRGGVVGGHQVTAKRRRIMLRHDIIARPDQQDPPVPYRVYGFVKPGQPWTYVGGADTGAVGSARGRSPQFRSSFGDLDTSRDLGFLNEPRITFFTARGPLALAVMSDGVADSLSDAELIERLTRGLQNGQDG
ncbi:MAG: hypothetical protein EBU88_15210, partial [Acidobacteria bacterium]|nr:hypothetical protein [Acidobacteriota bacterium]